MAYTKKIACIFICIVLVSATLIDGFHHSSGGSGILGGLLGGGGGHDKHGSGLGAILALTLIRGLLSNEQKHHHVHHHAGHHGHHHAGHHGHHHGFALAAEHTPELLGYEEIGHGFELH
nr:MOB kinase activator-like 2 isoform X2 [Parasteatoda tepidariorum]XP_042911340.1 MOB kinase activator-like 2 isoform X2 [Parasteatoda tepidariorum]